MKKTLIVLFLSAFILAGCNNSTPSNQTQTQSNQQPQTQSQENSASSSASVSIQTQVVTQVETQVIKDEKKDDDFAPVITVSEPVDNEEITSPVTIKGSALNSWFFEGTMPVSVLDANKKVIASGQAHALKEWTTEGQIPFEAELTFSQPSTTTGIVRIQNDNPSGLKENQLTYNIDVKFAGAKKSTVKLFFGNNKNDPNLERCLEVYQVTRTIDTVPTMGKAAIEELLKGPTSAEEAKGYYSAIPANAKLNSLTIKNGVAYADFNSDLENGIAGSCRVQTIRAQIEQELLQFPAIKNVVLSINGKSGDEILQP